MVQGAGFNVRDRAMLDIIHLAFVALAERRESDRVVRNGARGDGTNAEQHEHPGNALAHAKFKSRTEHIHPLAVSRIAVSNLDRRGVLKHRA